MKIKEIISVIFDEVTIYKAKNEGVEDFEDVYKGNTNNIPSNILEMNIRIIGVSKKGTIDIQVE